VRRAFMEALGQSGVPQLQLQPEAARQFSASPALPGVLAGGIYPNRWLPNAVAPGTVAPSTVAPSTLAPTATPTLKPPTPPGEFRHTFIIAVDDGGCAIIDQHVAPERVLFERVMERLTTGRFESQRLLVPMVLDLAPSACQALVNRTAELERFGFELESFGGA